ncbi:class I SAM-dependent methyltransferase [Bradyrhizobium sp. ORS 111]|uniref:class I SAM-dependent methyltransferase n=1 Tax=Bradyrhizobium sp. ORS 111 TaxID=1685958 RepID=UPI00388ED2C5
MRRKPAPQQIDASCRNTGIFWNDEFADLLEVWAAEDAWDEILTLLEGGSGRVLDVGCGVGVAMSRLARFPRLEVYGFDLSDKLVRRAMQRGVPTNRLAVAKATSMPFADQSFAWGYTIGMLHYLTDEEIVGVLRECRRVVAGPTFHQIPVSRRSHDMGWISTFQTVQNNSLAWWKAKFLSVYAQVEIRDSTWSDDLSLGKWMICSNAT